MCASNRRELAHKRFLTLQNTFLRLGLKAQVTTLIWFQCRAQAWALRAHPDIVSGIAAQKCDYKRFQLLPLGLEGPSKNNPEFLEVEEVNGWRPFVNFRPLVSGWRKLFNKR